MNYIFDSLKLFNSIKRNLFSKYSLIYHNFSDNTLKSSFKKKQIKEKAYYKSNYKDYSIEYNSFRNLSKNKENINYLKTKNRFINTLEYSHNNFFKSYLSYPKLNKMKNSLINYSKQKLSNKIDNKNFIKYNNNNLSFDNFKKTNRMFLDNKKFDLYSQNNKNIQNDFSTYIFDENKTFDDYKKEYSIDKNQALSIDSLTDYLLDEINVSGYSLSK